jgi:hypothetical protein
MRAESGGGSPIILFFILSQPLLNQPIFNRPSLILILIVIPGLQVPVVVGVRSRWEPPGWPHLFIFP